MNCFLAKVTSVNRCPFGIIFYPRTTKLHTNIDTPTNHTLQSVIYFLLYNFTPNGW